MSTLVRCPNPACTQVFQSSTMVPGTRYQCPGCGTQFAFQVQGPAASAPKAPPDEPDFQARSPSKFTNPIRKQANWYKPALFALLATLLVGFLFLVGFRFLEQTRQPKADKVLSGNYQIPKREGLKRDEALEFEYQADLVYNDSQSGTVVVFASRDFQNRIPSNRELVEGALEKLRKKFPDKVEYEKRSDADETLDGVPFAAYEFVGKAGDGENYAGEFFLGNARGYGYFLFSWGKLEAKESAKLKGKESRSGFAQLDQRQNWKPEGAKLQLVEGKGWQIQINNRFWTTHEIPPELKETNPKAVVRIEGKIPGKKFFAGEMAEGFVFVLDEGGDLAQAMAQAKEYLLKIEKPADESKITLETATNQDGEEVDRKVESHGTPQMQQLLRLISGGESQRLYLVQVGLFQKKTVFLAVSCAMGTRKLWEEELFRLADGLIIESP